MGRTVDSRSTSLFFTDGGIETHLIFNMGQVLPHFCAFALNDSAQGRSVISAYYRDYLPVARQSRLPFQFATDTWRANPDWGSKIGYTARGLKNSNIAGVEICASLQAEFLAEGVESCIAGVIGPRRDAWKFDNSITIREALDYHSPQLEAFAESGKVDEISAMTLTNTPEAIGIARACQHFGLPVVIAFTLETDGNLPGGKRLADAIAEVDNETHGGVAYFMINCAHPSHFSQKVIGDAKVASRLGGLRANASAKSHAELDEAAELDAGNVDDYAAAHDKLVLSIPALRVIGGCCGTDHRHISALCGRIVRLRD